MTRNELRHSQLFCGIDGGQTRTKTVIADSSGNILGFGTGGAIDHGKLPDSDVKLQKAVNDSINAALKKAGLLERNVEFRSIYFGLTGGADHKEAVVRSIIQAEIIEVGHDALTALYGATGGKPGIVVVAGTGSIVFGVNKSGESARAGGLGFLFSDGGSGFWLAKETIGLAIKEQDFAAKPEGLQDLVLDFFDVAEIRQLTNAVYNNEISRDKIAALAEDIIAEAENGNEVLFRLMIQGIRELVGNVRGTARQLKFTGDYEVCGVGGLFQNSLFRENFRKELFAELANASFIEPAFSPAIGALLLAYRNAEIVTGKRLLKNLEKTAEKFRS